MTWMTDTMNNSKGVRELSWCSEPSIFQIIVDQSSPRSLRQDKAANNLHVVNNTQIQVAGSSVVPGCLHVWKPEARHAPEEKLTNQMPTGARQGK